MDHRKESGLKGLNGRGILLGGGVGMLLLLSLAGLIAWLTGAELIALQWMDGLAAAVLLSSGFASGVAGKSFGDGKINSWLSALLLWGMLFALQLMLFAPSGEGSAVTLLAVMGGCALAHLIPTRGRTKYSRKKYGYR